MNFRPIESKDVDAITNILMNLNVTRYLSTHFRDTRRCRDYVRNYLLNGIHKGVLFTVVIELDKKVIGYMSCYDYEDERVRITYVLDEKYWGQGIMKNALPDYINFIIEKLNVYRIEALYVEENRASEALLLSSGFELEGIMRNYMRNDTSQQLMDIGLASYIREDE